jgi:hypothetical protein
LITFAVALAQAAATAQSMPAPVVQPVYQDIAAFFRSRGYSEEAIAILQRDNVGLRSVTQRVGPEMEALDRELSAAIRVPVPDPERIGSILRRRDALMNEVNSTRTRHTIDILAALSPADRRIYLQLIDPLPPEGFVQPRRTAPPAPPAPPRPAK